RRGGPERDGEDADRARDRGSGKRCFVEQGGVHVVLLSCSVVWCVCSAVSTRRSMRSAARRAVSRTLSVVAASTSREQVSSSGQKIACRSRTGLPSAVSSAAAQRRRSASTATAAQLVFETYSSTRNSVIRPS